MSFHPGHPGAPEDYLPVLQEQASQASKIIFAVIFMGVLFVLSWLEFRRSK